MRKIISDLTKSQADQALRRIRGIESRLRALGGNGNYASVEMRPTHEAGTVFCGPTKQRYGIFVEDLALADATARRIL